MALIFWDVIQYQRLLLMVVILGIGGSLQVGFQGSMITYASVHIKEFINETWLERFGHSVCPSTLTILWSSVVSIFGLGGLLGSMSSGCLAAKYGKKKCFWGSSVLMVASAFLLGFSKMARSVELILVGRFLCGISTGVCILLHPQYLGEVSPKKLRGITTSTASMFWCLGKVLGQVMGLRELLGSGALWPMLLAFSGTAALVPLLTLPFFPESPPYLLLHKGDEEGCVKAMKTFWGKEPHWAELDDLRKEQAALNTSQSKSFLEVVKEPSLRWQLYMLLVLAVTTQLSGIQAIYSYTFEVLQTAGFHLEQIPYLALGVSLCEFLSTILCPWFSWMPYCCLSLIFCFVFVFGMGPAGATVSLRMEIFDQSSRAPAFAISGTLSWVGVFVIGMVFPLMMIQYRGLFQMILVLGIGGSFPYGFHISVINYPSLHIKKFINETWLERHGSPLPQENVILLWSFIVSSYGIGGLVGSVCCGYLTTKYRKKKCQMFTNLIMLTAALFMGFSKMAKSFEMILLGRLLYGIGIGSYMGLALIAIWDWHW